MTRQQLPDHKPNPNYGSGTYRRRIHLRHRSDHVLGELEDDCHGFRVQVFHDRSKVTRIEAETLRAPLNTCSGATRPLQELVGIALNTPPPEIVGTVNPRSNCTHLYDLTLLAIAHCARGEQEHRYDVAVADQPPEGGTAAAQVRLNGQCLHNWQLDWTTIVEPEAMQGKPVLHGFAAWANESFAGLEQEAAFVLSKGVFVALSRVYDMSNVAGISATENESMRGVCYSYSDGVRERAHYLGTNVRDFSDTAEQLLRFQ